MSWREFQGKIIEPPDIKGGDGLVLIGYIPPSLVFLVMHFIPHWIRDEMFTVLAIVLPIAFVSVLAYSVYKTKTKVHNILGTFSLVDDRIIVNLKNESDKTFRIEEIQYLNIFQQSFYPGESMIVFLTNIFECRFDLYVHNTHYRYKFIADGSQQKENLEAICNEWNKQGYKAKFLVE